jgi:hypothetical protein
LNDIILMLFGKIFLECHSSVYFIDKTGVIVFSILLVLPLFCVKMP